MKRDIIGPLSFAVVVMIVVGLIVLTIHDTVVLTNIQAHMTAVHAQRDQQFAEIHKLIDDEVKARVDHRYRDIDAAADFAKRDAEIATLKSEIDKLERLK